MNFIKSVKVWVIQKIKKIKDFAIVPPNPNEGIVGFILRQVLLPDSDGNPSWTVTITSYVLALIAIISKYEFDMCRTMVQKFDPNTGKLIWEGVRGFSTEYWALIGTLTIAITYLFRQKQAARYSNSITETATDAIEKVEEIIPKV